VDFLQQGISNVAAEDEAHLVLASHRSIIFRSGSSMTNDPRKSDKHDANSSPNGDASQEHLIPSSNPARDPEAGVLPPARAWHRLRALEPVRERLADWEGRPSVLLRREGRPLVVFALLRRDGGELGAGGTGEGDRWRQVRPSRRSRSPGFSRRMRRSFRYPIRRGPPLVRDAIQPSRF